MEDNTSTNNNNIDFQQFLTFKIAGEEYCINLFYVREIREWIETTHLPSSPDFMKGVINLRGEVIPVFDLKCRFKMGETTPTPDHRIIVLAIGDNLIGLLVDIVSDIVDIPGDQIKESPNVGIGAKENSNYIDGIISIDNRMYAIININNLFGPKNS